MLCMRKDSDMNTASPNPPILDVATPRAEQKLAAFFAVMLGLVIVFAAGFAPSETMHNAAHDTRHSFALPCH